jgi:hypothetical protein
MTARFPVLNPLIQHSYQVVNARTVNNHQVFNEKPIDWIPPTVQHSRPWIEQILDLLVVNLSKGGFDGEFLSALLRVFPG